MIHITTVQLRKAAYTQGKMAKINQWERLSMYGPNIASKYWYAGYDGIKITNFTTWHRKNK